MVRGAYINRVGAERLLFDKALDRYLAELSASKRQSTAYRESRKAKALKNTRLSWDCGKVAIPMCNNRKELNRPETNRLPGANRRRLPFPQERPAWPATRPNY